MPEIEPESSLQHKSACISGDTYILHGSTLPFPLCLVKCLPNNFVLALLALAALFPNSRRGLVRFLTPPSACLQLTADLKCCSHVFVVSVVLKVCSGCFQPCGADGGMCFGKMAACLQA